LAVPVDTGGDPGRYYIRSGDAKKILVVGADVLSRISDPHDRDSMIYADGAGAVIMEGVESDEPVACLATTLGAMR